MDGLETEKIKPLIVIPVYNHAGTLREVVTRTLDVCGNVLVVDDGSTEQGKRRGNTHRRG
jgi:glycosyltransferase involved in cell wall biosynthesis